MELTVNRAENLKPKPDDANLGFGTIFTDHMFNMDYNPEQGWHSPRIEPYAPFVMDPATMFCTTDRLLLKGSRSTEQIRAISNCSGLRKILNA